MKYLVAIVPGPAIDLVTRTFGKHEIFRITVTEVEVLRASPYDRAEPDGSSGTELDAGPRDFGAVADDDDDRRLRVEVAVNEEFVPLALEALGEIGAAGHSVWYQLLVVDDAVHIRTGERGPDAI